MRIIKKNGAINKMKGIWLVKFLYYLFFTLIFVIAIFIFLDIMDFSFYDEYLRTFFHRIVDVIEF